MDGGDICNAIDDLAERIREEGRIREEQMDSVVASLGGIERALQSNEILLALHGIEEALRQIVENR
jgi:hypothetical protein